MKKKNNLDEAQELKMLQIEHNAYQIAFWGLIAAILIQQILGAGSGEIRSTLGELAVFLTMCLYVIIASLKYGIWDRTFKPTRKTNLLLSLAAGTVLGLFWFASSYHNYHKLIGSIATGVFIFLATAVWTYLALAFTSKLYKNRVKKLEEKIEEE